MVTDEGPVLLTITVNRAYSVKSRVEVIATVDTEKVVTVTVVEGGRIVLVRQHPSQRVFQKEGAYLKPLPSSSSANTNELRERIKNSAAVRFIVN